jgi:hypothetical protein
MRDISLSSRCIGEHLECYECLLSFSTYKPLGLQSLLPMKIGTIPSWVSTPENPKRQGYENGEVWKMISIIENGTKTH